MVFGCLVFTEPCSIHKIQRLNDNDIDNLARRSEIQVLPSNQGLKDLGKGPGGASACDARDLGDLPRSYEGRTKIRGRAQDHQESCDSQFLVARCIL